MLTLRSIILLRDLDRKHCYNRVEHGHGIAVLQEHCPTAVLDHVGAISHQYYHATLHVVATSYLAYIYEMDRSQISRAMKAERLNEDFKYSNKYS